MSAARFASCPSSEAEAFGVSGDHYATLGVVPGASAADLRAAYLKLARQNHPDKFSGAERDAAETRMRQINEAWNVLGVAHKRREYDAANGVRKATSTSNGSRQQRGRTHFKPFDHGDEPSRNDVDFDTTPIAGSKQLPRWIVFVPVALVAAGIIILAFGTMVNASGVFALGIISVAFGAVCFLMLPLFVMSRAERDPDMKR